MGSDHSPIVTCLDGEFPRFRGSFKFDRRWTKVRGFFDIVNQGWNSRTEEEDWDVVSRIRECKSHIAAWKKKEKTNSELNIKELKWRIHSLSHQEQFFSQELRDLRQQLNRAYREEEEYWRQQSRLTWLSNGDKMSKYFFSIAKQRATKNRILQLLDEDSGCRKYTEDDMAEIAVKYFSNVFSSEMICGMDSASSFFFKENHIKVNDNQNSS